MNEHIIRSKAVLNLDYSRDNLTEDGIKSLNEYANKSNMRHLIDIIGLFMAAFIPYIVFPLYTENIKVFLIPLSILGFCVFGSIMVIKLVWLLDRRTWYHMFLYDYLIDKTKVDTTLREITAEEARRYYRNIQIAKVVLMILFIAAAVATHVVFDPRNISIKQ